MLDRVYAAGTEFIPMALTWLKQRRFEEYGPDPGLLERLRWKRR